MEENTDLFHIFIVCLRDVRVTLTDSQLCMAINLVHLLHNKVINSSRQLLKETFVPFTPWRVGLQQSFPILICTWPSLAHVLFSAVISASSLPHVFSTKLSLVFPTSFFFQVPRKVLFSSYGLVLSSEHSWSNLLTMVIVAKYLWWEHVRSS